MKITVYAICKNEERNIGEFIRHLKDADNIVIVDTGSTDSTMTFAASMNDPKVILDSIVVDPFSFSIARNICLTIAKQKAPADFYLFLDLDERLPANWRHIVDSAQTEELSCLFFLMQLKNGSEVTSYPQLKAHRDCFSWKYSAHEVLISDTRDQRGTQLPIVIEHKKDESKERNYLVPLEQDYTANTNDHRCVFYYGRELYYAGNYEQAYQILRRAHAGQENYFIGQQLEVLILLYKIRVNTDAVTALGHLYEALSLSPFSREILYMLALHFYDLEMYRSAIGYLEHLLNSRSSDNLILFKDVGSHTWKPHDLMSVCFNAIGDIDNAVYYCEKAYELNPMDTRIANNYKHFMSLTEQR